MGFIQDYCELFEGTEIPTEFSIWCGLTGISAALKRDLWIDMGTFSVFPNVYTILVAGSGRCRKSSAIDQMDDMLRSIVPPLNIMSQKTSTEGMIQSFHGDNPNSTSDCVGVVIADELIIFLNRAAYEAGGLGGLLIQLYDCKKKFSYKTIARGKEELTNTCLSWLSGTTIDWLKLAIPIEAVGGGLTSRILFVYLDQYAEPVPIPYLDPEKKMVREGLILRLQKYASLRGEVKWTKQARAYFEQQYREFYKNSPLYDDPTLSGYASRRNIHWLKLSMLFACSEGTPFIIKRSYLKYAENLLNMAEKNLPKVMAMITSTEKGHNIDWVMKKILKTGVEGITRSALSRAISHRIDAKELAGILETLSEAEKIETVNTPNSSRLKYIAVMYLKKKKRRL